MTIALPHTLGQHFAYALGRLGSLELELLKQTDIDRLLGAANGQEAVKMLRDIEFVATPEGDAPFQETLDATVTLLKENVEKIAPEGKHFIFDILWLQGDRAKLSYEAKKKLNLTSAIASPPSPPVTADLDRTIEESFSSPQEIDDAIAALCSEEALRLAKMSKSYTIYTYVIHTIDIEESRRKMRNVNVEMRNEDVSPVEFENESVESLRELLEDMRRMILGPEALFAYAARAMNHVALLKVLLTGKVNNLPIQEIKSLLPPLL